MYLINKNIIIFYLDLLLIIQIENSNLVFYSINNTIFCYVLLIETDEIIIKRKTLQYLYKLIKKKYGTRKKYFLIF